MVLAMVLFTVPVAAFATTLPAAVLKYVKDKDPEAKIRFDGMVIYSNGETYLPVIPQDPTLSPIPQQVLRVVPEEAMYPDLVEFDNTFFLIRLVQTASGRLTMPRMDDYPIELREGLLPQDLILPTNLFIPSELKVILGELPYNPTFEATTAPQAPVGVGILEKIPIAVDKRDTDSRLFLFSMDDQQVLALNAGKGDILQRYSLNCVPSDLVLSKDQTMLFATCLTTNELVALDVSSSLIKTRIPVGKRPGALLHLPDRNQILVSNRFASHLSLVDTTSLMRPKDIPVSGNGGVMARLSDNLILVADGAKPQVHVVDLDVGDVVKTLQGVANTSAMVIDKADPERPVLWLSSRTEHEVVVVDILTNREKTRFRVGSKPTDLAIDDERVYVLSAKEATLTAYNKESFNRDASVSLPSESFPVDMTLGAQERRLYIIGAGQKGVWSVDTSTMALDQSISTDMRAQTLVFVPAAGAVSFNDVLSPVRALTFEDRIFDGGTVSPLKPSESLAEEQKTTTTKMPMTSPNKAASTIPVMEGNPTLPGARPAASPGAIPLSSLKKPWKKPTATTTNPTNVDALEKPASVQLPDDSLPVDEMMAPIESEDKSKWYSLNRFKKDKQAEQEEAANDDLSERFASSQPDYTQPEPASTTSEPTPSSVDALPMGLDDMMQDSVLK